MLKIEITDPHLMNKDDLIKTAQFLFNLAGHAVLEENTVKAIRNLPNVLPKAPNVAPEVPDMMLKAPSTPPQTDSNIAPRAYNPFAEKSALGAPVPQNCSVQIDATKMPMPKPIAETYAPSVELDSTGMAWDGRIHARTKSKNADGTWRLMRGIDPQKVKDVTQEISSTKENAMPVPPMMSVDELNGEDFIDELPEKKDTIDFPTLMTKITNAVGSGKVTHAQVIEVIKSYGVASIPVIPTRPELIPFINEHLDSIMKP